MSAYGAAAAKDQAGLVFKAAAELVAANPHLQARLKVLPSTKRILRYDGGGFYAVLSADGDLQDGIEPSLAIRDEVHRWKTLRAETLRDVLVKGQISRAEPLDIGITTAGAEYESPLWWREYQQAKKVLDGSLPSDTFYAAVWEADVKRIESDPEYWKSREARIAANPSHEDLGGFLKDSAIVGELEKALAEPSERSKYLRYHLNVPLKAAEDPVFDMAKWQACGGGVDMREWPEYDVDLLINKWGLLDKPCWAGVDASWTTDLTAVVFVFPPFDGEETWTLLPFFWMPQERVAELERVCRVPYSTWIRQGFIETTAGNGIDMRAVKQRIHRGRELFELREMPFDRFNFRTQAMELLDEGVQAVEITQSFSLVSGAKRIGSAELQLIRKLPVSEEGTPAAAGAGRTAGGRTRDARGLTLELLQEVCDLVREAVVAVDSAGPNFVERRAEAGIFAQLQSAYSVAEIAFGGFSGLVDCADDSHRFVLAVFALSDQYRQTQIGVGLEWDRKSVVVVGLRSGVRHSVSLLAPPLITPKADRIKGNLRHHAEKPAGAGARRAREGGVRCYGLIR